MFCSRKSNNLVKPLGCYNLNLKSCYLQVISLVPLDSIWQQIELVSFLPFITRKKIKSYGTAVDVFLQNLKNASMRLKLETSLEGI